MALYELLVVDDEITTVIFLKNFFSEEGFEVRTAYSGKTAIEEVEKKKPHLVLLDIQMDDMDGIQALKTIKAKSPEVKVLMMTGNDSPATLETVLQAGADYYILKPFMLRELLQQVRDIISTIPQ